MLRTQSSTRELNRFGLGKDGFTEGNPVAGIAATVVGMDSMNALQEEVVSIIEGAGVPLSGSDLSQALKAIKRLYGGYVTTLSSTSTLTLDQCGLVLINASAGNITLTLPLAAALAAAGYTIARTDTVTANTVTVQRAGADTAGGASSFTIPVGGRVRLISDGVNAWYRPGQATPLSGIAHYNFQPAANTNYPRSLTATPVTRGRLFAASAVNVQSSGNPIQPSAQTNVISINGVQSVSNQTSGSSLSLADALVEAGVQFNVTASYNTSSGTGWQFVTHTLSYLFVPEVG